MWCGRSIPGLFCTDTIPQYIHRQDVGTTTRGWIWLVVFTPVSFVLLCYYLLSFDVSIKVVELPWLTHGCGNGMFDAPPLNRDIVILGGPSRRRRISVVNERCALTVFLFVTKQTVVR